jgi:hypothetical protein
METFYATGIKTDKKSNKEWKKRISDYIKQIQTKENLQRIKG